MGFNYKLLFFLLFFLVILVIPVSAFSCDHVIEQDVIWFPDGSINGSLVLPGETVCVQAGERNRLRLNNFHGTLDQPIVFVNYGGQVFINASNESCEPFAFNHSAAPSHLNCAVFSYGFTFLNSSHVKVVGSGDSSVEYGFKIRAPFAGTALGFEGGTDNVEASFIEIYESWSSGIKAKTDPDCDLVYTRNSWSAFNFSFHHTYIHDLGDEAFYVGNSFFRDGQLRHCVDSDGDGLFDEYEKRMNLNPLLIDSNNDGVVDGDEDLDDDGFVNSMEQYYGLNSLSVDSNDDGVVDSSEDVSLLENGAINITVISGSQVDVRIPAHALYGVSVFDNVVSHTGFDGIQVSSSFDCDVFNNTIGYDSQKDATYQQSGVIIGGGSSCDVVGNHISNGEGPGILFLGHEGVIQDNVILNPGFSKLTYSESKLLGSDEGAVDGMYVIDKSGDYWYESPRSIHILNNFILNPKRDAIRYYNHKTTDNEIRGNVLIHPGSKEYYVLMNQWAGFEDADFIFLQQGLIDRNQINGVGTDLDDFLIVDPPLGLTMYDNLGFTNYSYYEEFFAISANNSSNTSSVDGFIQEVLVDGKVISKDSSVSGVSEDDSLSFSILVKNSGLDELLLFAVVDFSDWDIKQSSETVLLSSGSFGEFVVDVSIDSDDLSDFSDVKLLLFALTGEGIVLVDTLDFSASIDSFNSALSLDYFEVGAYSICSDYAFVDLTLRNSGFGSYEDLVLDLYLLPNELFIDRMYLSIHEKDVVNERSYFSLPELSSGNYALQARLFDTSLHSVVEDELFIDCIKKKNKHTFEVMYQ